ncbi:MAG: cyclic nucleotide-binding domain-containing protein [Candidatus Neomarinimicrobiota bacterium]
MMKKNCNQIDAKALLHYEIFGGLTEAQVQHFCTVIKMIEFKSGDVILQEGTPGHSILLLLDGKVEISQALTLKTSAIQLDTREKSILALSSEQHPFFGEMSLFSEDDRRTATVKALSVCILGRIASEDFFAICHAQPEIGFQVMQNIARVLSRRLKQANQNVLKLTTAFSLMIES